jgi:glutaredoxin
MRYLFIILLIVPFSGFSEIYKWTDENGNVHFGDSPKENDKAEKVVVEVNSYENITYDNVEFYQGSESNRVTMHATSWCGYCSKARSYFKAQGISYIEYDIEKDERAKRMYDLLGGKGVPVILVGKKRMNGFSVAGFERIYK